ncbi:MAG: copper resistance protein NlpE [Cytophagaceae bacterium]|nr:copper resistance protein NlpE [Cytophagaceae bacterium]
MKKCIVVLSLLALTLAACQTKSTVESGTTDSIAADETAAQVDKLQPDTLVQSAAASTSSSATTNPGIADRMRQWTGTYAGTLPCADCPGIKTSLVLNADGTYTMRETYLGKEADNPKQTQGQWKTNEDGTNLELDYNKRDETVRFRQASDNSIKMLGRDGAEITSKLNYSLTKQ